MGLYSLIVLIGAPLVLIGIGYMYVVESNWYDVDFKLDEKEDNIG
jgi:formate hydrogenlyase subunit 3/multisubunit Na+/H+ antiporter MnhD subunit